MATYITMVAVVRTITARMTFEELAALYFAVVLGLDPRSRDGYEKAKALFTEVDGTKMRDETKAAFLAIVAARLFS